jgi:hypothetical protein
VVPRNVADWRRPALDRRLTWVAARGGSVPPYDERHGAAEVNPREFESVKNRKVVALPRAGGLHHRYTWATRHQSAVPQRPSSPSNLHKQREGCDRNHAIRSKQPVSSRAVWSTSASVDFAVLRMRFSGGRGPPTQTTPRSPGHSAGRKPEQSIRHAISALVE